MNSVKITPGISILSTLLLVMVNGNVDASQMDAGQSKMKMTTKIPESIIIPNKLKTRIGTLEFFDGLPTDATVRKAYDFLDFQRAVDVFLDEMRAVKSPAEIDLIRRASQLAGLGLLEAMRCSEPGRFEYQLEACARFVYQTNDARRDAYTAIVGSGPNAFMGHYFTNDSELKDGDLILMDFSPEYHYYTSDVTRMWPVSGTFSSEQLELYNFIVTYRSTLLKQCRPGVTVRQVLDRAAEEMRLYVDSQTFSKPEYKAAVERALTSSAHMQHPVGLAVHDVGDYKSTPLRVGEVFSVDAMLRVPAESLYVRIEDVVVITETGVENFTDFIPVLPEEIEAVMREPSILDRRPPVPASEIR